MIKNKFEKLLNELKKFKVQTILLSDYKKRNDRKTFDSRAILITTESDTDEAFKSMHQGIMTKIKDYVSEDCIVLGVIIKNSIKIFDS